MNAVQNGVSLTSEGHVRRSESISILCSVVLTCALLAT